MSNRAFVLTAVILIVLIVAAAILIGYRASN